MKNRKFNKQNKDKRTNTIIEIRKEMLQIMHDLGEDLDRELYDSQERDSIRKEVYEIAEMIRDKDRLMPIIEELKPISRSERIIENITVRDTRARVIALLHRKKDSIVATQYDREELEIVEKELIDVEKMVVEKDRIAYKPYVKLKSKERPRVNKNLSKYFKLDSGLDLE